MNSKARVSFALLSFSATLAHAEWYDLSSASGANISYLGSKKYVPQVSSQTAPYTVTPPSYVNMPSPGVFNDYRLDSTAAKTLNSQYASHVRLNFSGVNFNDQNAINRKKCDYRFLVDVRHFDITNNSEVQNSRVVGQIVDSSESPMGVYAYTSTNLLFHKFAFPHLSYWGGPESSISYSGYTSVDSFSPPAYAGSNRSLFVNTSILSVSGSTVTVQLDSNFYLTSCKTLNYSSENNCPAPFSAAFLSSPATGVFGVPKITGATFQSSCAP